MAVTHRNKKSRLAAPSAEDKSRRIKLLQAAAKKHKIDPALYVALANQESSYHDKAVSDQFAIGMTQMTPEAWVDIGGTEKNFNTLFDENVAADSGAKFLALMLKRLRTAKIVTKDDPEELEKLMATYNAGMGSITKEGFAIKSKKKKDGTYFNGLMSPKRRLKIKDKNGVQRKDAKGNLMWRTGETHKYVTKIMAAYKKAKAVASKAPKKGS